MPETVVPNATKGMIPRMRAHLGRVAGQASPITYQALARALSLTPPNTIHQVTETLEQLMREDAAAGRPFMAALVVSKMRGGLPAPGFFDAARRLGCYAGDPSGPAAQEFHETEFASAVAFWSDEPIQHGDPKYVHSD